jgi:hypothetical protein
MSRTIVVFGLGLLAFGIVLWSMAKEQSRLRGIGGPSKQETLTICTQIRDESAYVVEWVEHYLNMGASKVIIYDDGSSDNLTLLEGLYRQAGRGSSVEVRPVPKISSAEASGDLMTSCPFCVRQRASFMDCIKQNRGKTDWILVADTDEFFYPAPRLQRDWRAAGKRVTLARVLTALDHTYQKNGEQLGSVVVPCSKFGVSGQEEKFSGRLWQDANGRVHYTNDAGLQLVTTSHLRRRKTTAEDPQFSGLPSRKKFAHSLSNGVKTFGKMEAIRGRYLSVHQQNIREGYTRIYETHETGPGQGLKCNHYFIRSRAELETKRSGDVTRKGVTIDPRNEAVPDMELADLVGAALRERLAALSGRRLVGHAGIR